ncbi:DUF7402 domain-containing protein [Polaribacter butkevichii]|uniref:F5/8 type C domain-containing protein n=1 Tax=Polaribacter butkevichii TaxID=218490 RepID=A0A2P6CCQ1_9FLAO|nr:discoidin domain-containing protein [Polaribacter butkevichii]PQJ72670.1 hypothetical protein BTO14_05095 [Polaribacter butkevichii]
MKKLVNSIILAVLLFFAGNNILIAQVSAVYGGGAIYNSNTSINELRSSGFNTVIVWTLHIESTGKINFNYDFDLIDNGQYIGGNDPESGNFVNNLARLKQAPTSVNRIEFGIGAAGAQTFNVLKSFYESEGFGPGTTIYKNFKKLRETFPMVDAINNDDEVTYDLASTVAFTKMLASLGFKNAIVPYNRDSFWRSLVQQVNAAYPGNVDRNYIQCYAGGAGNNPCQTKWDFGITNIGGRWGASNRESPSQIQNVMQNWKNSCSSKAGGGFIWIYDEFDNTPQTAQYANAINTAFQNTPPPPPTNTSGNLARSAQVSVSSQYSANYSGSKAIDGIKQQHNNGEWASNGEKLPKIRLTWNQPVSVNKIILYDRPNATDGVGGGILYFSDGSQVPVDFLFNNGQGKEFTFNSKTITWVQLDVTDGINSLNNGLSEFEVYGSSGGSSSSSNVALNNSSITASSQYPNNAFSKEKVADGIVGKHGNGEWASNGESNPYVQINWNSAYTINKVVLFDRPNATDKINGGTLTFSDGSRINVAALPNNGAAKEITFANKTVTAVRFTVTNGSGYNVGLSEFQVFGTNALRKSQQPKQETITENTNQTNSKVSTFPNPFKNLVNVMLPVNKKYTSAEVYNLTGQLILKQTISEGQNALEFNFKNVARSSIYLLRLTNDKESTMHKLIRK